ncbi:MAG TPA: uracil-DNA glycosylase family protein [Chitinophagaceae bacterium]|nr:uracil-DNA glycosylase family protein [Chitinophagaceae bacterium]
MNQKIKPCRKVCKTCGLYINQLPVLDFLKQSHIFWVGLSAVQFDEGVEHLPLSPTTRTGALINTIEQPLIDNIGFYKTNLVKCVPLKENGKIRYPIEHEMEKCYPNFQFELEALKPSVVFLLGKQVSAFIMKKMGVKDVYLPDNFRYKALEIGNTFFVPVHHPSFMLVYKRKQLSIYIKSIQSVCRDKTKNKLLQTA